MEQKQTTQVLSRARSIRLAFFVDLDEASHPILDAIFRYSFSIWGGRFSLIVPCINGEPLPSYISWLAAFDPDLIYSYVNLTSEKQQDLHETFYPSVLQHHGHGLGDGHVRYSPSPSISPLGVGTLLPLAGAPGHFDGARGVQVIAAMGRMESDRFLADSFGLARPQLLNSMRSAFADFGSVLFVIEQDELQPRQRYVLHGADATVPDLSALLTSMTANRRALGVAQLSALFTPRLDLRSRRWSGSFNIVVGDTVADRILYWNARALMSPWRDGDDVDLCIPRAKFNDPDFVESLCRFLNRRNLVNGDNGNGPNRATLRSISLDAGDLASLVEQMRRDQNWITYNHERVASIAECVPEARSLEHALFVVGQHGFRSPNPWQESFSIGNELHLTSPGPEHMRYVPVALVSPLTGAWAVDLDIERMVDHSPYSNVRHRWRLPRRLRVTRSFLQHYQLTEPHGETVGPRVSAGGILTLFAVANTSLPKIALPTDQDAIIAGLQYGRDWMPFDRHDDGKILPQLCYKASRSSAGRYFWGVYQLFGNIDAARAVLLHQFWRKQLEEFGATDQRTDVRQERMQTKLLQRLGNRNLELAKPDQLHTLSDIVLQESDAVRMKITSINWTGFEIDFRAMIDRFNAAHPPPQGPEHDLEEEDRWRMNSLREAVQDLCKLGVLHQGYEHRCRKCLHRSWVAIADLKPDITCEVCHDVRPAPVNNAWEFRLNGFLRKALQRYGVGPLFWVLSRFQQRNSSSFWFEGPLDIFFNQGAAEAGRQETDIDLTIIDNGVVRMCEVKQSERAFKDPAGLARIMTKLRPDIAMIAVMDADSPALQRKFAEFSAALADTGIKPELLTLDANDISADPFF